MKKDEKNKKNESSGEDSGKEDLWDLTWNSDKHWKEMKDLSCVDM